MIRQTLATLCIAIAAAHAAGSDPLQRGIEETQRAEFANALVDFEAALHLQPQSPDPWFRLGLLFGRMGRFTDAEAAFRRALELRPSFAEAYFNLGLTQIANPENKLDWPAAISSFRKALEYQPEYPEAANYLGAGLLATGDVDGALAQLARAVHSNPALAEAHLNLGLAYERKEQVDAAEREYRCALEARPGYAEAATALGKLLFREGQLERAEHEARAALAVNPDSSDAHYLLAQVERAKKLPGAAQEFEQVREAAKRKADAVASARITNEGLQAAARGDFAAALASERQAVALKPDFGIPHYNLGLILADTGDWSGAAGEFIEAAALMPGTAGPWFGLGRVLHRAGDWQGAAQALTWAKRLAPSDARIEAELTSVLASDKSAHGWPQLSQPPFGPAADTAAAHFAFASVLSHSGDLTSAAGELLRGLALQPADEQARRQLAGVYRARKLDREATLEEAKASLVSHPN